MRCTVDSKEQILLIANIIKPAYCNKSSEDCGVCMTGCMPYKEAERLYERGCRVDTTIAQNIFDDVDKAMAIRTTTLSGIRFIDENDINKIKRKYGVRT